MQVEDRIVTIRSPKKYWTGAHAKHMLRYHIIWIAKHPKRDLRRRLTERSKMLLCQTIETNAGKIEKLKLNVCPKN